MNPERQLPIYRVKDEILDTVKNHPVTVIVGETGCGKTTQIPQLLYDAGWAKKGLIACTEPTRIAAYAAARRLAEERHWVLGQTVGMHVRFEHLTGPETRIEFMTEGIMMQEVNLDPHLFRYGMIMVDEVHERHLYTDFLLGYLKSLLNLRRDLRVVIASATVDPKIFSDYFHRAPVITIPFRLHEVKVVYKGGGENVAIRVAVDEVKRIATDKEEGDVLVFMPGLAEITRVVSRLKSAALANTIVLPLYGSMDTREQELVFGTFRERKIVVATNAAETSLTIPGIKWVVDSGLARVPDFEAERELETLTLAPISQASAKQRAGRAGRTRAGSCIRLCSREQFERRPKFTLPEIYRSDLTDLVLAAKAYGVEDLTKLDLPTPAPPEAVRWAEARLRQWGALNENGTLSHLGTQMSRLPLAADLARLILASRDFGCVKEVVTIASFLSVRDIFLREWDQDASWGHRQLTAGSSDASTFLNIWEQYGKAGEAEAWCRSHGIQPRLMAGVSDILNQTLRRLASLGISISQAEKAEAVDWALANILKANLCVYHRGNTYRRGSVGNIVIAKASALAKTMPRYFVTYALVKTGQFISARYNVAVKEEWLEKLVPEIPASSEPPAAPRPLKLKGVLRITRGGGSKLVRLDVDLSRSASTTLGLVAAKAVVIEDDNFKLDLLPLSPFAKSYLSEKGIAAMSQLPKSREKLEGMGLNPETVAEVTEVLRDLGYIPQPALLPQPEDDADHLLEIQGLAPLAQEGESNWLLGNFLQKPIQELGLSGGILMRLVSAGLKTVGELTLKTDGELLKLRKDKARGSFFNHNHLEELKERLAVYGLSTAPDLKNAFGFGKARRELGSTESRGTVTDDQAREILGEKMFQLFQDYRNAERKEERITIRNIIATENIRLPWKASNFYWYHPELLRDDPAIEPDDLFIEGSIGLLRAVESFDYTLGFRFSTHAYNWITGAIRRALCDQAGTIRLAAHMVGNMERLIRKREALRQRLERWPTVEELAEALGQKPETVQYWLDCVRLYRNPQSLNQPVKTGKHRDEEGSERLDLLWISPEEEQLFETATAGDTWFSNPLADMELELTRKRLEEFVDTTLSEAQLLDVERRMIALYFGLGDGDEHTLEQIGEIYGITRERVRQRIEAGLAKMRTHEVWERAREFIPALPAPASHPKVEMWQKAAECWREVARNYETTWNVPDFVGVVSKFYGVGVDDLLKPISPESRKGTGGIGAVKDVLAATLHCLGGYTLETVGFWMGSSEQTATASMGRVRKGFKTVGESRLLEEFLAPGRPEVLTSAPEKPALVKMASIPSAKIEVTAAATVDEVLQKVAEAYGATPAELVSEARDAYLVEARQEAIYLLRGKLSLSFPAIGKLLKRDHSTIMHGYQKARTSREGGGENEDQRNG